MNWLAWIIIYLLFGILFGATENWLRKLITNKSIVEHMTEMPQYDFFEPSLAYKGFLAFSALFWPFRFIVFPFRLHKWILEKND